MITTSLEIAFFILTIEFALIALVILFRSYRSMRRSAAKATLDATELVNKVSEAQGSRKSALETVLRDKYQYEGDGLTKTVDEFMQRERAFYNTLVSVFLGRDKKKLSDLNSELTRVVAPWISITPKNMVDSSKVDSLVADNSRLESELQESKAVLEKMIEEYNRTFHVDSSAKESIDTPQDESIEKIEAVSGEGWDTSDINDAKSDDLEGLAELADELDDIDTAQPDKESGDDSKSAALDDVVSDTGEPEGNEIGETEEEDNIEEGMTSGDADSDTSKVPAVNDSSN